MVAMSPRTVEFRADSKSLTETALAMTIFRDEGKSIPLCKTRPQPLW